MKNLEKYDVAIIGAGICGITAGSYLTKNDLSVKILDKGKAIGGRLATRRIKFNDQLYQVDYGCKYLEANSFEFSQQVVELINNDIAILTEAIQSEDLEAINTYKTQLETSAFRIAEAMYAACDTGDEDGAPPADGESSD